MSIASDIRSGKFDAELQEISDALRIRKEKMAQDTFYDLEAGDTVEFVETTRPTYLRGLHAKVVSHKTKKLVVRVIDAHRHRAGRFQGDITTSASLVRKVS